jgi:PAS domain S-box-containing protein
MGGKVRILFIEQKQKDILAYKQILNSGELDDFSADFASSGKEGLSLYQEGDHKVVIIGHPIGKLTAINTTEMLLSRSKPPVAIIVTDQGGDQFVVDLLKMGVDDYIVKDVWGMYLKLLPKVIKKSLNEKYLQKQKQDALTALRQSQERYQRLEENLLDTFVYSHNIDGVFTYISPSVEKVLGYSTEEFLNHYSTYLTDHPINAEVDLLTQLSIMGRPQKPYEVELFHKNGHIHRLYVSEIPVFDDNGRVIAVEGIAKDITRLHRTYDGLVEEH